MTTAPIPQPQYISLENVYMTFGQNKVAISDNDSVKNNEVAHSVAISLVAQGEGQVIQYLSPYYVTMPKLVCYDDKTNTDHDWLYLQTIAPFTYSLLYNAMVYSAGIKILENFIAKNNAVSGAYEAYQVTYQNNLNRFLYHLKERDDNGVYLYQMWGLKPLQNGGISRQIDNYVISGEMAIGNYQAEQQINPELNWLNGIPNSVDNNEWIS